MRTRMMGPSGGANASQSSAPSLAVLPQEGRGRRRSAGRRAPPGEEDHHPLVDPCVDPSLDRHQRWAACACAFVHGPLLQSASSGPSLNLLPLNLPCRVASLARPTTVTAAPPAAGSRSRTTRSRPSSSRRTPCVSWSSDGWAHAESTSTSEWQQRGSAPVRPVGCAVGCAVLWHLAPGMELCCGVAPGSGRSRTSRC